MCKGNDEYRRHRHLFFCAERSRKVFVENKKTQLPVLCIEDQAKQPSNSQDEELQFDATYVGKQF